MKAATSGVVCTVLDLAGLSGGEEVDHGTEHGDDGHRRADRQQPAEAVADHRVAPEREESGGDAGEAHQRDEVGGVPRGVDEHRVQLLGPVARVTSLGVERSADEERGAAGDQEHEPGAVEMWRGRSGGAGVAESGHASTLRRSRAQHMRADPGSFRGSTLVHRHPGRANIQR